MKLAVALTLVASMAPGVVAGAGMSLRFSDTAPGESLPAGWKASAMSRHLPAASMALVGEGRDRVFGIDADHAAGGIEHPLDMPAATVLRWRWKIDHSVATADLSKKSGDDFAARVYVFFDVPPSRLSWMQRIKLRLASHALGLDMPTAALCYVWDNSHQVGTIAPNVYFDQVRTIVLRSGDAHAGKWLSEHRDLDADFRAAFGRAPPRVTGVALASDTDNTGAHVKAWFGDLTFTPAAGKPDP